MQDRYQDAIDASRPGTAAGLDAAQSSTAEGTRINPTTPTDPVISDPADTYGGDLAAVNVADPNTLIQILSFQELVVIPRHPSSAFVS